MNVYKGRLLKKSSNWKSKLVLSTLVTSTSLTTWLSNIAFDLRLIWLQSCANFGCNRFRITVMQDIVYKLLSAAICSCCAVLFESEWHLNSYSHREYEFRISSTLEFILSQESKLSESLKDSQKLVFAARQHWGPWKFLLKLLGFTPLQSSIWDQREKALGRGQGVTLGHNNNNNNNNNNKNN